VLVTADEVTRNLNVIKISIARSHVEFGAVPITIQRYGASSLVYQ